MLLIIPLCALVSLCVADSSPTADPQFNYGQQQGGGYFYQARQPRAYGKAAKGGCKEKKCTNIIEVTETSFKSVTNVHEYNTIFPEETTILTTSFSWSDIPVTKSACSKTQTTIPYFDFISSETTKTIHECVPTLQHKTFTNWEVLTHSMVINQCVPTSNTFTIQSITSTTGPSVVTTVGFGKTLETKTQFIPATTVWKVPVCTEVTKCKDHDKPSHYPTPPSAYGPFPLAS